MKYSDFSRNTLWIILKSIYSGKLAIVAGKSPILGTDPHVAAFVRINILDNEISILQSCLYIESGLQEQASTL